MCATFTPAPARSQPLFSQVILMLEVNQPYQILRRIPPAKRTRPAAKFARPFAGVSAPDARRSRLAARLSRLPAPASRSSARRSGSAANLAHPSAIWSVPSANPSRSSARLSASSAPPSRSSAPFHSSHFTLSRLSRCHCHGCPRACYGRPHGGQWAKRDSLALPRGGKCLFLAEFTAKTQRRRFETVKPAVRWIGGLRGFKPCKAKNNGPAERIPLAGGRRGSRVR